MLYYRYSISTHTLTWSVTILVSVYHFDGKYFNSHAHVERDISKLSAIEFFEYFNSHAHVERDRTQNEMYDLMRISTHTLTWSVTGEEMKARKHYEFQLTRSRGA